MHSQFGLWLLLIAALVSKLIQDDSSMSKFVLQVAQRGCVCDTLRETERELGDKKMIEILSVSFVRKSWRKGRQAADKPVIKSG